MLETRQISVGIQSLREKRNNSLHTYLLQATQTQSSTSVASEPQNTQAPGVIFEGIASIAVGFYPVTTGRTSPQSCWRNQSNFNGPKVARSISEGILNFGIVLSSPKLRNEMPYYVKQEPDKEQSDGSRDAAADGERPLSFYSVLLAVMLSQFLGEPSQVSYRTLVWSTICSLIFSYRIFYRHCGCPLKDALILRDFAGSLTLSSFSGIQAVFRSRLDHHEHS